METKLAVSTVAISASAETAIAVSDAVHWASGEGLVVRGVLNITPGAGTTAVVMRVRKGNGTGGALVGAAVTLGIAAAANDQAIYEFVDTAPTADPLPGTPAGAQPAPGNQYTVTLQQTGGTGAGNVSYGTIGVTAASTGW